MADIDNQHLQKLRTYWRQHHAFSSMAKLCEVAGYLKRVEGRIAPTKRFFARPLVGHVRAALPQPLQDEGDFEGPHHRRIHVAGPRSGRSWRG